MAVFQAFFGSPVPGHGVGPFCTNLLEVGAPLALVRFSPRRPNTESIDTTGLFLTTTSHFPHWIEPDDRRFYVSDVNHPGHASGLTCAPKRLQFCVASAQQKDGQLNARFMDEQMTAMIKEQEAGETSADPGRRHGISSATF